MILLLCIGLVLGAAALLWWTFEAPS